MLAHGEGVCVIIAAYNARGTIARSVRSALAQKHVREVIVCDDGSADDTAASARLQDDGTGRLTVITLSKNAGPSVARNVAIEASRSPYVCVLDSDDYLLPGRIARLLEAEHGDWDMIADDIIIVPETLEPAGLALPSPTLPGTGILLDLATFVTANISRPGHPRREWGFLKPLMRRAFLDRHNLRYDETLRLGEDYALYVRALIAGARFRIIGACGYVAIERASSISSTHSAPDLKNLVDFDTCCLERDPKLDPAAQAALAAHRKATQKKFDYRTVLNINQARGRLSALAALGRVPSSLPYILSETMRAKAPPPASDRHLPAISEPGKQIRFLIGAPFATAIELDAEGLEAPKIPPEILA